jgi:hypothetical protein
MLVCATFSLLICSAAMTQTPPNPPGPVGPLPRSAVNTPAPVLTPPPSPGSAGLPIPLDQSVNDVNPLATSFRHMQEDFRQPLGFSEVYPVPGRPDLLMRVNGSVYAVFPQSVYSEGKKGIVPMIPANTVFYIGAPPGSSAPRGFTAPKSLNADAVSLNSSLRELTEIDAPLHAYDSDARDDRPPTDSASTKAQFAAQADHRSAWDPVVASLQSPRQGVRRNTEIRAPGRSPKDLFQPGAAPERPTQSVPQAPDEDERDAPLIYDNGIPSTIANDPSYRVMRLGVLMQQAYLAEAKSH